MKKNCCTVVFDRKKKLQRLGYGKVEIHIKLPKGIRKYVTIRDCTEAEWLQFKTSSELTAIVDKYEAIVFSMLVLKEELTRDNLDYHLSGGTKELRPKKDPLQASFIDFMEQGIIDADILHATRKHHYTVWRSLIQFGQIKTFADLTPANIMDYDTWLRNQTYQGKKIDATTVDGYHKRLKRYVRLAHSRGIIEKNPYDSVRLVHGKSKERKPLVETELVKLREAQFDTLCLERVRDLFIFAAYTGLAYVDVMDFNFHTMTEKTSGMYYIDGRRTKTGSEFYTPILPPAMEILKKYNYQLPKISNQKLNQYLHAIEYSMGFTKKLTFHVARHSFATLMLSHDVPIEKVARMLGHQDIKTTQIYGKILKNTIQSHSGRLTAELL